MRKITKGIQEINIILSYLNYLKDSYLLNNKYKYNLKTYAKFTLILRLIQNLL